MSYNKILQGVKFGMSCCAVWTAYLFEPLPHVVPIDRITYPLADGAVLIVMGLQLGILFGKESKINKESPNSIMVYLHRLYHCLFFIMAEAVHCI
jgi:hypothetical protein